MSLNYPLLLCAAAVAHHRHRYTTLSSPRKHTQGGCEAKTIRAFVGSPSSAMSPKSPMQDVLSVRLVVSRWDHKGKGGCTHSSQEPSQAKNDPTLPVVSANVPKSILHKSWCTQTINPYNGITDRKFSLVIHYEVSE